MEGPLSIVHSMLTVVPQELRPPTAKDDPCDPHCETNDCKKNKKVHYLREGNSSNYSSMKECGIAFAVTPQQQWHKKRVTTARMAHHLGDPHCAKATENGVYHYC